MGGIGQMIISEMLKLEPLEYVYIIIAKQDFHESRHINMFTAHSPSLLRPLTTLLYIMYVVYSIVL